MPWRLLFFDQTLEVKISKRRLLSSSGEFPTLFAKLIKFCLIEQLLLLEISNNLLVFPLQLLLDVNHWWANGFGLLWFMWWNEHTIHFFTPFGFCSIFYQAAVIQQFICDFLPTTDKFASVKAVHPAFAGIDVSKIIFCVFKAAQEATFQVHA